MKASRITVALAILAVHAGCGDDAEREAGAAARPTPLTYEARGVAVTLPAGWEPAPVSLTPALADPREVLSVGTFPLRYRETDCGHMAGSALEDLGLGDAFVTLLERGLDRDGAWRDFPQRPERFGPGLGGESEAAWCVPDAEFSDHWFGFTDGGRHFHVLVAFGPRADPLTRDQAWAILDGMRVDPGVRPGWAATS